MLSILVPCVSPLWQEELRVAKLRDSDEVIRFNQRNPTFHFDRARVRHAYEGYVQGILEYSIQGWLITDTLSPGGQGVIFSSESPADILRSGIEWTNYMPSHRELVVAFIVPQKQDDFLRALKREFQYIF